MLSTVIGDMITVHLLSPFLAGSTSETCENDSRILFGICHTERKTNGNPENTNKCIVCWLVCRFTILQKCLWFLLKRYRHVYKRCPTLLSSLTDIAITLRMIQILPLCISTVVWNVSQCLTPSPRKLVCTAKTWLKTINRTFEIQSLNEVLVDIGPFFEIWWIIKMMTQKKKLSSCQPRWIIMSFEI